MNFTEFVGIDISKLKFDVRIHSNQKASVFENNGKGFLKFIKWIDKNDQCEKAEILIAMEHTGLYSLPLSVFLMENNYRFVLISGLEIKRSLGIQRGKDDVIDAKRIAEYAYQKKDKIKPTQLPVKNILQIRRLLSLRERLVKQRAGYLMDKGENEIFLNQDENKILFEVIEQSIEYLDIQMDKVEKELYNIIKSDELMKNQFELITSIKGVGKLTALFMIAFTHCFTSFDNWRQFASYAGTAPFPYRSGTSIKGKNKVSNLANKRLKTLLNMCARSAIVCNPEMKIYFQNRKAKGENGMSAINIIRNKLLSRIFAVIKRGTPYVNTLKYAA
ncbi:MAG: transposase [Ignavibacteria bacterium]|nr:transposase [Ignavibacteria bacterium]